MSDFCHSPVGGFEYPKEQIAAAVERKGLLTMEIEFSLACNFRCPYCYSESEERGAWLTAEQIDDVILQAKQLGAGKIIILGGEPMIYPSIHDRIRFIRTQGMQVEMFTNGSCMSEENAKFMFDHNVAVVLKINSRKASLQNEMAGRDDAYDIIWSALENLRRAGYPAPDRRLAASSVICEQNIGELPDLWRWLRKSGIEPYFEMITPQGRGSDDAWRALSVERQHALFEEIARIDREEFGYVWEPQPPLVGNRCLRHSYSCLVSASGEVMPCVGVTVPLGNVTETPLKEILEKSEVMENLRDYRNMIKGPCGECEKAELCYGCRGAAYQLTGDYLASDPLCWRNRDRQIESLPEAVDKYLPHRRPMLIIDTLCSVGERKGHISAGIRGDNPFLDDDGVLEESAYVEMIAQAVAALEGFHMNPHRRANHQGVLLGVRRFSIKGASRKGDRLDIYVEKLGRFGEFGAVSGTVTGAGKEIAAGELSFVRVESLPGCLQNQQ